MKNNQQAGAMLSHMLSFTVAQHADQYDRGGNPYILHCLKVMHWLKTDDIELQCIALGHDVIEDTGATYAQLRQIGMTERVIEGIKALTKVPGESFEEYQSKVIGNRDAVLVKMQDLRHNSDIRRLKGVTEKDVARIQRYHKFYLLLQKTLKEEMT